MMIGSHSYYGGGTEFREFEGQISIGDYCSLGDGILILAGGEHRRDRVSTYPFDVKMGTGSLTSFSRGDVVVGSDVWIGSRTLVLPGVTIGHGAVIGAGSVVTRNIPPYAVAVGVPARVISYRFDDATIARLLATEWWDWPEERVLASVLLMADIPAFLEAAEC